MVGLRAEERTFSPFTNQVYTGSGSGEEQNLAHWAYQNLLCMAVEVNQVVECSFLILWWWITYICFSVREKFPKDLLWALGCHLFQGEGGSSIYLSESILFSNTLIGHVRLIFLKKNVTLPKKNSDFLVQLSSFWVLIFPVKALHQKVFSG